MQFSKSGMTRLRLIAGYLLFAAAIGWVAIQLPSLDVDLKFSNMAAASALIAVMLALETVQFRAFIVGSGQSIPPAQLAELVARKAILNAIFPAQAGTLVVMRSLTTRFQIPWSSYGRWVVATSAASVAASLVVYMALLAPLVLGIGIVIATVVVVVAMGRRIDSPIGGSSNAIWLTSLGLLVVRAPIFWLIFSAMDNPVSWTEALTLAIVMNAVNQFPITPGNLGVRELTLGGLSEWAGVPGAVGILVGLAFMLFRVATYGLIYLMVLVPLGARWTRDAMREARDDLGGSTSTPDPLVPPATGQPRD